MLYGNGYDLYTRLSLISVRAKNTRLDVKFLDRLCSNLSGQLAMAMMNFEMFKADDDPVIKVDLLQW